MRHARTIALSTALAGVACLAAIGSLRVPVREAGPSALTAEIVQRFPAAGRSAAGGQGFQAADGQQWRGMGSELGAVLPGRYTDATVISHGGVMVRSRPLGGNSVAATSEGTALTYRDAYAATDVLYTSTASGTEEFLLLRDQEAPTRFSYELNYAAGVTARLASGAVVLADARGDTMRIAAPTAVDAAGKRVDQVCWQLHQVATGSRLDLVVEAGTATYPLLIDPSWVAIGTLAEPEGYAALNYLSSISAPILTGGFTGSALLDSCQVYNTTTHVWSTSLATMHSPHAAHSATVLNSGQLLVVGGYGGVDSMTMKPIATAVAETFDGTSWTATVGTLNQPRGFHSAVLLSSNKVLIIGGDNGGSAFASSELYAPTTGLFTTSVNSMSTGREAFGVAVLTTGSLAGQVLVAGGVPGQNGNDSPISSCELYDPTTDTWSASPPPSMGAARANFSLITLPNGTVMAVGGDGNTGGNNPNALSSCEIFDPVALTWSPGPSLNVARQSYAMIHLGGSPATFLVAGGSDGNSMHGNGNPLANCEVFDSGAGTWSKVPSLTYSTISATSCLLPSGHALVAGGALAANNSFTAVTDEYDPAATDTAPTLSGQSVGVLQGGQAIITFAGADADGNVLGYQVIGQPTGGSLSAINGSQIIYQPNAGTTTDSFSVVANDGVLSSAPATVTITVQGTPVLTLGSTPNVPSLGGTIHIGGGNLSASESGLAQSQLIFHLINAPVHGALQVNGTTLVPGNTFTMADLAAGPPSNITYQQNGTFTTFDAFTVAVTDNIGTPSTPPQQQVFISVSGSQAAPTGALSLTIGGPDTVTPGVKYVLLPGDLQGAETGGYPAADLKYTITTLPTNGKILVILGSNNNPQLGLNAHFSQADVNAGLIAYKMNTTGVAASDSLSVSLTDGTTTVGPSTLTFTTASATYLATNTPMIAEGYATITNQNLAAAAFPAATPTSAMVFQLVTAPAFGQLQLNNNQINGGDTFTQADIDSNNLSYNGGGFAADTFTFTVGGAGPTYTFTISNWASPVQSGTHLATVQAGGSVLITTAILGATSTSVTDGELVYTVSNAGSAGSLMNGITALTSNSTFTQVDVDNGNISYNQSNASSTSPVDQLNLTLSDGSGANNNGSNFVNLAVVINHPPVVTTDRTVSVNANGTVIITSNDLLATDLEQGPAALTYTLQSAPAHGSLQLLGTALAGGDHFTQADVNAGSVTYLNSGGAGDSYTVSVADGAGGTSAPATMIIAIASGPLITANAGNLVQHSGSVTILQANLQAGEVGVGPGGLTFHLTSLPGKGHLFLVGQAPSLTTSSTFTQLDINSHNLSYAQDAGDGEHDVFTITASDGTSSTLATLVPIAINHAPVLAVNATMIIPAGGGNNLQQITTSLLKATDIEQSDVQLTFTLLTLPTQGAIVDFTGATLGVGATFSQEEIDNALISYQAGSNPSGTDAFSFSVSDGAGGSIPSSTFHISFPSGLAVSADAGLQFAVSQTPPTSMNIYNNLLSAVDGNNNNPTFTWTVTNSPSGAIQRWNGSSWSTVTSFTSIDLQSGNVRYTTTATTAGSDSIVLSVTDGSSTVTGVVFPITMYAQPTISSPSFIVDVGTQVALQVASPINVTDANVNGSMADQQVFTLTALPTGTLLLNGLSLALGQSFTQDDLNNGHVVYAAPGSGTNDSFSFDYSDGFVQQSGGPGFQANIILNALPFITNNGPLSTSAGNPTVITTSLLSASDNDGAVLLTFVVTNAGSGTLTVNGSAASAFTQPDLVAGHVSYTSAGSTSLVFYVSDGIGGQTAPQSFLINQVLTSQTISWNSTVPTPQVFGAGPFTLSATATSGLAVVYSVVGGGPGSITGNQLSITGAGSITVAANQAGNGTFAAAGQITQVIVVNQAAQSITFPIIAPQTYSTTPLALAPPATASSLLPITFSIQSGPATITGDGAHLAYTPGVALGSITVLANQAGNANYLAAAQASQTFTVSSATQTITFPVPATQAQNVPVDITTFATATSNLPISYTVDPGIGTLTGNVLSFSGTGTVVVHADQAGNVDYGPASTVTQSITVLASSQSISFTAIPSPQTYGVGSLPLAATATSGLTPVFSVLSGPGSVSGTTLTITGAGTVVVAANQAGGSGFAAAPQVTQSITVNQAALSVTATNAGKAYGTLNPALAFTTSGLAGSDAVGSVTEGTAALTGSGVGPYAITISAAVFSSGSATNYAITYNPGTLTVSTAALTITATSTSKVYGAVNPVLAFTTTAMVGSDAVGSVTEGTAAVTGSGVGPYAITISAAVFSSGSAANYAITYTPGTLTVTAKPLTITATNAGKVYGTVNPVLAFTTTAMVGSDAVGSVTEGTAAVTGSGVGPYAITISAAVFSSGSAANYAITYTPGTLTVSATALTITATNAGKVYGTVNPVLAFTTTAMVGSDAVGSVTEGTTAVTGSGVGPYAITISAAVFSSGSATNYAITYNPGTLTVSTAALTITATSTSKVYGTVNPVLAFTTSGLVGLDAVGSVTEGTVAVIGSGVGPYAITISAAVFSSGSAANYAITYTPGTLTVSAAALTINATSTSKVYGAVNPVLAFTTSGLVGSDAVGSVTEGTAAVTGSGVGPYAITISAAVFSSGSAANYTITYTPGTLTVTAAALTITATNTIKVYGAANPVFAFTTTALVGSDAVVSVTEGSVATAASGVGGYAITISAAVFSHGSAANYAISYTLGTLTVTAAPLTITATNVGKVYGTVNPVLAFTATGLVGSDAVGSVTEGTAAVTGSGVGPYAITISAAVFSSGTAGNYAIAYTPGTLTVSAAALTITATSTSKVYGAANPVFALTTTGIVAPDAVGSATEATAASASSAVGGYVITISAAVFSSGSAANYTITYAPGTLTVTAKPLTITATNAGKVYGAANPVLAFTTAGLVAPDAVASVTEGTTATAASAVGGYAITISAAVFSSGSAANYSITYFPGTLTVSPAVLTVTAASQGMVQGGSAPALTYTISGFLNGDTAASATTGIPTLINPVTSGSGTGVYVTTVTIGSLSATNYTFTLVDGSVTVANNVLIVTANAQTKVYGAAAPALTYTITGFVGGDTQGTALSGAPALADAVGAASAVGVYTTTLSLGTLAPVVPNKYAFTLVNGSLTVTAAPLIITSDDLTKVAGLANPTLTVSYAGFVNGDTAASLTTAPTITTTAVTGSAAGAYPITASGAVDPNYVISYVAGTLTVTAAGAGSGSAPQGSSGGGCGLGNGVVGLAGLLLLGLRMVMLQGGRRQRPR